MPGGRFFYHGSTCSGGSTSGGGSGTCGIRGERLYEAQAGIRIAIAWGTRKAAALYAEACERRDDRACYWLGAIHEKELNLLFDKSHVEPALRSEKLQVELQVKDAKFPVRSSPAKQGKKHCYKKRSPRARIRRMTLPRMSRIASRRALETS